MNDFVLVMKSQLQKLRRRERQYEEESISFCPPLPLARELKVVRCDQSESHGCELRRSPGLAVAPARSNQDRCGAFPRGRPAMGRQAAVARAYTESALQSRGGDGLSLGDPDQAGAPNRLPEHEVHGECGLQRRAAGLGLTRKTSIHCVPDKTVTRGRPEEPNSTESGVWKTCSSNSR